MDPDQLDPSHSAESVSHNEARSPVGDSSGASLSQGKAPFPVAHSKAFPVGKNSAERLSHRTAPPPLAYAKATPLPLGESAGKAETPAPPAAATVAAFPGEGAKGEDFPAECQSHRTAPPPFAFAKALPPPLGESALKAERPAPPAAVTVAAFPGEGAKGEDFPAECQSHRTAPPPFAFAKALPPPLGESALKAERPAPPAAVTVAAFPGEGAKGEDFPAECQSHRTAPPPFAFAKALPPLGESALKAERPAPPAAVTVAAFPGEGAKGEDFPAECQSHRTAPPPFAFAKALPPPLGESALKAERPAPPAAVTVAAFPGEGAKGEDFPAECQSHRTAPPPFAFAKALPPPLGESALKAERPAPPAAVTVAAFPGEGAKGEDFPAECQSHRTAPPPFAFAKALPPPLGESALKAERPAPPAAATVAAFPGEGAKGEDFPAECQSHRTAPPPFAFAKALPPPLGESALKAERPAPPAAVTVAAFPGEGAKGEDFPAECQSHRTAPPPFAFAKALPPPLGESALKAERPAPPAAVTVAAFPGEGAKGEDFPAECQSHRTAPPPFAFAKALPPPLGESALKAERPAPPAAATVAAFPGEGDEGEDFWEVGERFAAEELNQTEGRPHTEERSQLRSQLQIKGYYSLETSASEEDLGGGEGLEEMKRRRDAKDARGVMGAGGEGERGAWGAMEKGGGEEPGRKRQERRLDTGAAAAASAAPAAAPPPTPRVRRKQNPPRDEAGLTGFRWGSLRDDDSQDQVFPSQPMNASQRFTTGFQQASPQEDYKEQQILSTQGFFESTGDRFQRSQHVLAHNFEEHRVTDGARRGPGGGGGAGGMESRLALPREDYEEHQMSSPQGFQHSPPMLPHSFEERWVAAEARGGGGGRGRSGWELQEDHSEEHGGSGSMWNEFWWRMGRFLGSLFRFPGNTHRRREQQDVMRFGGGELRRGDAAAGASRFDLSLPPYTMHQSQTNLFFDTAAFAVSPPPAHVTASSKTPPSLSHPASTHSPSARASGCRRVLVVHRGDITKWCVDGASDVVVNAANESVLGGGGMDGGKRQGGEGKRQCEPGLCFEPDRFKVALPPCVTCLLPVPRR
ncbi:unnamed protein product [Closterium sp. Naga37s-1]|nr:unnamed protein product [Closterium sp. Naga37s-1]